MRVRLNIHRPLTDKSGKLVNGHPGFEVDLEEEQAIRLIESGQAATVAKVAEAAIKETIEAAVLPPAKKGKR